MSSSIQITKGTFSEDFPEDSDEYIPDPFYLDIELFRKHTYALYRLVLA